MRTEIIKLITDFLNNNTRVLLTEADFQFELAMMFRSKGYDVRLEYPINMPENLPKYLKDHKKQKCNTHARIDIVVGKKGDKYMPIELKFVTCRGIGEDKYELEEPLFDPTDSKRTGFERTEYLNQLAYNETSYNYWADVKRIEELKQMFPDAEPGIAVILTNNPNYWKGGSSDANYAAFKLTDNKIVTAGSTLSWGSDSKPKKPAITLIKEYTIKWTTINLINGVTVPPSIKRTLESFRYLILPE